MTLRACWAIQQGDPGGLQASSLAKAHVGEAAHRITDRCVQLLGGLGVNHDGPVARFAQEVRAFRIYDGPTEVHKWSLGKRFVREASQG